MTELLTVVLPTHERPERLRRAARSILDQEYPFIELVVVDDGSTRATARVLDELTTCDHRVVAVRLEEPLGPSGARNAGLAVASGELIAFCDDDDVWLPGSAGAAVAASAPSVGVVYGWHQVLHEESGRCVTFRPPEPAGPALMRWINLPACPFGVVRRSMVGDALNFDTGLYWSEDWDLWLRCSDHAPMSLVPQALYRYVQHGQVRVTNNSDGHEDGHRRFLAKHRSSMSPACIAHHELAMAFAERNRHAAKEQIRQLATHPARFSAAGLLAGEALASRFGQRRQDPGLPLRFAASALHRSTGSTRLRHTGSALAAASLDGLGSDHAESVPPDHRKGATIRSSLRPLIGAAWRWTQLATSRDATRRLVDGTALVVSPHPDDETIGCSLLMARKAKNGTAVVVVLATDGRGGWYSDMTRPDPEQIVEIRHNEWHRALDELNVPEDRRCELGFPDGELSKHEGAVADRIGELLERFRPSQVFVPAPRDPHPDHRALARATCRAVLSASGPAARPYVYSYRVYPGEGLWPEGGPPPATVVMTVRLMAQSVLGLAGQRRLRLRAPDSVPAKKSAIGAHESQRKLLEGELRFVWRAGTELYRRINVLQVAQANGADRAPR